MSDPTNPQPSRNPMGHRREDERLQQLTSQLSTTINELIKTHIHQMNEGTPHERVAGGICATAEAGFRGFWRFLWKHRAAFSELCIIALTVLSVWYAVRAIGLAKDAIDIGQSWSKTSYENALVNTWAAVQAACKENATVFPVSDSMFENWKSIPGVTCTSKETCVCEVLDPSAYVGDQILSVYYPFLNNTKTEL